MLEIEPVMSWNISEVTAPHNANFTSLVYNPNDGMLYGFDNVKRVLGQMTSQEVIKIRSLDSLPFLSQTDPVYRNTLRLQPCFLHGGVTVSLGDHAYVLDSSFNTLRAININSAVFEVHSDPSDQDAIYVSHYSDFNKIKLTKIGANKQAETIWETPIAGISPSLSSIVVSDSSISILLQEKDITLYTLSKSGRLIAKHVISISNSSTNPPSNPVHRFLSRLTTQTTTVHRKALFNGINLRDQKRLLVMCQIDDHPSRRQFACADLSAESPEVTRFSGVDAPLDRLCDVDDEYFMGYSVAVADIPSTLFQYKKKDLLL